MKYFTGKSRNYDFFFFKFIQRTKWKAVKNCRRNLNAWLWYVVVSKLLEQICLSHSHCAAFYPFHLVVSVFPSQKNTCERSHTHTRAQQSNTNAWKMKLKTQHTRTSVYCVHILLYFVCYVALCCETRNIFGFLLLFCVLFANYAHTSSQHWVVPFCVIHNTFTLTYYVYTFINKIRAFNGHVFFVFLIRCSSLFAWKPSYRRVWAVFYRNKKKNEQKANEKATEVRKKRVFEVENEIGTRRKVDVFWSFVFRVSCAIFQWNLIESVCVCVCA